jgi:uncharacterized protein YggU (UPF0235/DUF167 family)
MKFQVVAHTKSRKPRIEKDIFETLHVYVSEPAIEGKANDAIIASLADFFKTSKSAIRIIKGQKSRIKLIEIISN